MKNPRIVLPALLLVFLFGFGGCYTILKHPAGGDSAHQYSQDYYRENCLDCHPDYHEYPYGYFYGSYPDYYFNYPRYGRYYAYPWWWEHYWYDGDGGHYDADAGQDVGDAHDKADRSRSRTSSMVPPYSSGAYISSPTFHRDGGDTTPAAKPGGTTNPAGDQTTNPEGKTKVSAVKKTDDNSTTNTSGTETKKEEDKGKKGSLDKKRKR